MKCKLTTHYVHHHAHTLVRIGLKELVSWIAPKVPQVAICRKRRKEIFSRLEAIPEIHRGRRREVADILFDRMRC